MRPLSVEEISEVVAVVDLFLTVHPGCPLIAAVDVVCDLEGIVLDSDRRLIRHFVERRLATAGVLPAAGRAAA